MNEQEPIHIISLGAGVQSSTMALMAARGEITPMPKCAVFADTQAEPKSVYEWLDWLEKQLPFPVIRVTKGNLAEDACRTILSKGGKTYTKHAVPAFIISPDGRIGIAMRQCTGDHKIEIIYKEYQRIREGRPVIQWIGISLDEVQRMKDARKPWVKSRWPLIDMRITRSQCLSWMKSNGFPVPPRSACTFCPYHSDAEWRRMKRDDPEAFQQAVEFEANYQNAFSKVSGFFGKPFLHRTCKPLSEVSFDLDKDRGVMSFFDNECEGMCGV